MTLVGVIQVLELFFVCPCTGKLTQGRRSKPEGRRDGAGGPASSVWALLAADVGAALRSGPTGSAGGGNGKPAHIAGLPDPFAQVSIAERFYERVYALAAASEGGPGREPGLEGSAPLGTIQHWNDGHALDGGGKCSTLNTMPRPISCQ